MTADLETHEAGRPPSRGRRVYVAVMTLLLLAAFNHEMIGFHSDPLTVAQNKRVEFVGPRYPGDPIYSGLPLNTAQRLSLLYIGNSQSYAIMDYQPNDRSAIAWLSYLLNGGEENATSTFAVRYGSDPNLRMSEFLIKSARYASDVEHRPDVVVAGVVLDSFRWLDAREEIATLAKSEATREALLDEVRSAPDLPLATRVVDAETSTETATSSGAAPSPSVSSLHTRVLAADDKLQAKLDAHIPIFAQRKNLYGWVGEHYLTLRNLVAHVDTSTRRPIPSELYNANLQLMEMTARLLRRHGVLPILYFAPVRPVEPNPYDPADITRFRRDFMTVCRRSGAICLDYSNLVPEPMWTNYPDDALSVGGTRDYAHFTSRGHRRLAEQLQEDVGGELHRLLAAKAPQKSAPVQAGNAGGAGS